MANIASDIGAPAPGEIKMRLKPNYGPDAYATPPEGTPLGQSAPSPGATQLKPPPVGALDFSNPTTVYKTSDLTQPHLAQAAANLAVARGISPSASWLWGITEGTGKNTSDNPGYAPQIDYVQNDAGWKFNPADSSYTSPEGLNYSQDEIQAEIDKEQAQIDRLNEIKNMTTADQITAINTDFPELKQYFPDVNVIPSNPTEDTGLWRAAGALPNSIAPDQVQGFLDANLAQRQAYVEDLSALAGKALPDQDNIDAAVNQIMTDPVGFLDSIRGKGGNASTIQLLQQIFPDMTEPEARQVLNMPQILSIEDWVNLQNQDKWPWEKKATTSDTEAYKQYVDSVGTSSLWTRSLDTAMGKISIKIGAAAKWLGLDGLGQSMIDQGAAMAGEELTRSWNPRDVATWMNGAFLAQYPGQLGPEIALNLAIMSESFGSADAAIGALGLGKATTIIVTGLVGGAVPTIYNSTMAAGQAYDAALTKGMTPNDAKAAADSVFLKELATNEAVFTAMGGIGEIPIKAPLTTAEGLVEAGKVSWKIVGGKIVGLTLTQVGQAILSDIYQRQALGVPIKWDDDMKMIAATAAVQGLAMTAGFELLGTFKSRVKDSLPTESKEVFDTAHDSAVMAGQDEQHAITLALDAVAETPEGAKVIEAVTKVTKIESFEEAIKPQTEAEKIAWEQTFEKQKLAADPEGIVAPRVKPELAIPQNLPGMPETGIQTDIFGGETPVTPRGRGRVTQISMDEAAKLAELRRVNAMSPEEQQAYYESQAKAEVGKEYLANDPIMNYRGRVGGTDIKPMTRDISYFLNRPGSHGDWPEFITQEEAQFFEGSRAGETSWVVKEGPHAGQVDFGKTIQQFAENYGMTEQELTDHVLNSQSIRGAGPGTPKSNLMPSDGSLPKDNIIAIAKQKVEQTRPGTITKVTEKIPLIGELRAYEEPGIKMVGELEPIKVAMVADTGARADVNIKAASTRLDIIRQFKDLFGSDVFHGKALSDIKYLGGEVKNNVGTLLDIVQRASQYDLTPEQKSFIASFEARNNQLYYYVTDGYGVNMGLFVGDVEGAHLPNVDISEDVVKTMGETRAIASGRGKTRFYASAFDRMEADPSFKPELDVQKLIEGMDSFKASAAAGQTFREAVGMKTRLEVMQETHPELYNRMMGLRKQLASLQGSAGRLDARTHDAIAAFEASPLEGADLAQLQIDLEPFLKSGPRVGLNIEDIKAQIVKVRSEIADLKPSWEVANLKPYQFVQEGLYGYFKTDAAAMIKEALKVNNNSLLRLLTEIKAGAFSGDFSPLIGIQRPLQLLADPLGVIFHELPNTFKIMVQEHNILAGFSVDGQAQRVADNLTEWSEYAAITGKSPLPTNTSVTTEEFRGGYLSKIPGFNEANESLYVAVTDGAFSAWQRDYKTLMKAGVPEIEAKVAAGLASEEVTPSVERSMLGQSASRNALFQAGLTSYSFLRKPLEAIEHTLSGLVKIGTLHAEDLTPVERLSIRHTISIATSMMAVSITSAVLDAKRRGDDVQQAVLSVLPGGSHFADIIINNKIAIPIGGPYRSLFKAIWPQTVANSAVPIPFGGLWNYLSNRTNPVIGSIIDLLKNKDYYGKTIVSGNFPVNVLRGLEYELESAIPLSIGAAVQDIRDKRLDQLWTDVISQFAGFNTVQLNKPAQTTKDLTNKLGQTIAPDPNQSSFTIEPDKIYSMTNLSTDIKGKLTYTPLTDVTLQNGYDPIVVNWVGEQSLKTTTDVMPSTALYQINTDASKGDTIIQWYSEWQERAKITDPAKLMAYDKANPNAYKGNITRQQYDLLLQYAASTDKTQFLADHPELKSNPRESYLIAHPDDNASLALWGQADIYSKAAYDDLQTLLTTLDVPVSAISNKIPPKSLEASYFKWFDLLNKYGASDAETKLTRLNDATLEKWGETNLNWAPLTDNKHSLQIQVTYRANYAAYLALPANKRDDYLKANPTFRDQKYLAQGLDLGATESMALKYVAYLKASNGTAYRKANPDFNAWYMSVNPALKPLS